VLTRHLLAALAAGIAANDALAARAALDHVDPVARGLAKRKLGRALIDAELVAQGKPPAHVMRVAALALARRSVPVDADRIEAAYAELPRPTMPRVPKWTIATALVLVALAGGIAYAVATRPGPAARSYHRPMPPPSADAFTKGGVPLHDPKLEALLAAPLTKLVVDAGAATRDRRDDLSAIVTPMMAPPSVPPALAKPWSVMIDTFKDAVHACERGGLVNHNDMLLREAARDVSAKLVELGQGYVIEGRIHNGYAYLQAYRVDEVVFVKTAGQPRRVLSVSRVDHLALTYNVLGLHTDGLADPVVMDERIDLEVADDIIPVLAKDAPYPLADHEYLLSKEGKELAALIGQTVRAEYAAALGADAPRAQQIATLLVERQGLIEQWRDALARRHIGMVSTDELFLPDGLLGRLEGQVPHYQVERVQAIEDQLAELDAPRIADRIHELVAATVRRHEAEHGYDFDRESDLRYPQPLADWLGLAPHDDDGNEVPIVRAARSELSAFLSQIANDPVTPHAAFWHLAEQAFSKNRWYTGEMYAGYVVIEGLARHLAPDLTPVGLGNERLAPLARRIAQTPGPKLREAAQQLWSELYGEPYTTITP
jgi:hypothetical protein